VDKNLLLSSLSGIRKASNEKSSVWVYTKDINNKFILFNENKPTFVTKFEAYKGLKMSAKTINKYLDTNIEYKGLYFYSVALKTD
jgi:hypothetical protein